MVDILLLFNANLEGLCLTRRIHAVNAIVTEGLNRERIEPLRQLNV